MGKSASGKDTIYNEIRGNEKLALKTVVPYTTRPIREGEIDGSSYFFCDEACVQELMSAGKIIEIRTYETIHGPWRYFTADDGQIDLDQQSSILIATLEAYEKIRDFFGADRVVPIYIEVEDGERLTRALSREKEQKEPKYAEMCRRFLADSQDFSEDKIEKAGIQRRFVNHTKDETIRDVEAYIKSFS